MIVDIFSAVHCTRVLSFSLLVLTLTIAACNDAPTDLGSELVPGTDTLYALSSLNSPVIDSAFSTFERLPYFSNPARQFLFGRTDDSEARLFIEFNNYPKLGSSDSYVVVQAFLIIQPNSYVFGDSSATSFGFNAYELNRQWSPAMTWDSVWKSDGSSDFYSNQQKPLFSFSGQISPDERPIAVPISRQLVRSWLIRGNNPITRSRIFGLCLEPSVTSSIRQFRNVKLRVVIARRLSLVRQSPDDSPTTNTDMWVGDSTKLDSVGNVSPGSTDTAGFGPGKIKSRSQREIIDIDVAASSFVNAPAPTSSELIVQGAHTYKSRIDLDLTAIPKNAVILSANLRVTIDTTIPTGSNTSHDEILKLIYTPFGLSNTKVVETRGDSTKSFRFGNLASLIQDMMRNDRKGTLRIGPSDANELWIMNRIRLFPMTADTTRRPKLSIIYSTPSVIK